MKTITKVLHRRRLTAFSIRRFFIVVFRFASECVHATFAERKATLVLLTLVLGSIVSPLLAAPSDAKPPNVLFIAIDDLRPELGCYGATEVKSPNIDRVAAEGLLFERAYCQVPVCGASRACLMTGILPTPNRFVLAKTHVDEDTPGAMTMPQVFRDAGYTTLSNGKIFHFGNDTADRSWSEPAWHSGLSHSTNRDPAAKTDKSSAGRSRIYESPDVPDDAYGDGKTAERTIADLQRLKASGKPFFLACGFIRPHMPFYAPKKYWDMYDRDSITLSENRYRPKNAPKGLKGSNEYRSYGFGEYEDGTDDFHRMMRHGYFASTSYVDKLVGDVMGELDRLELTDNTIIVIWGDHGWNLGEHDFWGKHNTLNTSTRVPLIIKVPAKIEGKKSSSLVGAYDIFPTLCTLANLPIPESVQGRSFANLLDDPKSTFRDHVYTRYVKGDAVVSEHLIYTNYGVDGEMLFDLSVDPHENLNVASDPNYRSEMTLMKGYLAASEKTAAEAKVNPSLKISFPDEKND